MSSILSLLSDGDAEVRARAGLLAAELVRADEGGARPLAEVLASSMRREASADTRVAQVEALERLSAFEALRPALEDPAFAVRLAAALALLRVDQPDAASFRVVRAALAAPRASRNKLRDPAFAA